MAIKFGDSTVATGIVGGAAKALKVAGLLGIGYGVMCALGVTADVCSHKEIADAVFQAAAPVIKSTTAIYEAFAKMAGVAVSPGSIPPTQPNAATAVASGLLATSLISPLLLVGVKLSEMVDRAKNARAMSNEMHAPTLRRSTPARNLIM